VRRVNFPSSLNSPETNLSLVILITRTGWTNNGEPSLPQAILDVQEPEAKLGAVPPSFLPRELLLSIFPLLEDGGGELTLGAGVHRAVCMISWTARRNFVHWSLHLNVKWIVFSFFCITFFDFLL